LKKNYRQQGVFCYLPAGRQVLVSESLLEGRKKHILIDISLISFASLCSQ